MVKVRSEINGKVAAIPAGRGARVNAGDILCRLEVDAREVNLAEAQAARHQADLEYKGALDLAQKGLQSEINIAQAKARLESGNAAVRRATLDLWNTTIRAPFAGVVEHQAVEVGDFLSVGGECATLLEMDPLLVVGQVAERDIGAVAPGATVAATLLTGEQVSGHISYIAQSADKVTRSYRIEVEVPNPESKLKAGITSELVVPLSTTLAHHISPAVLVLDDDGGLGIRAVDAQDHVTFHHIEIISEGPEGIWITGAEGEALPEQMDIITVGQETVFAGQRVRIELIPLTSLAGRQRGHNGA